MAFPTVGSWISSIKTTPESTATTNIKFVTSYTTGSSNVEYAIYSDDNTLSLVPFTTATNGSNVINVSGSVFQDYRVHFRMIGYPSLGFNPVVSNFAVEQLGIGAQMQTVILGSDIQLTSTQFSKAFVSTEGSYSWNLTGSVSSDAGSTWTPISTFGTEFDITSGLGSECLIRLIDDTGSVVLDRVLAYFHTSDVR